METFFQLTNVELIGFHEKINSNNSMFHLVYKNSIKDGVFHVHFNKHKGSMFLIAAQQEIHRGFFTDFSLDSETLLELLKQAEETTGDLFSNNNRYRLPYPRLVSDKVNGLHIKDEAFDVNLH